MGIAVRIAVLLVAWAGMVRTTSADVQAVWVGQVEMDLVGPFFHVAPSDTQDLHFRLERLTPNVEIANIRIVRRGGGEWQYKGPSGVFAAAVERVAGSTFADVYVEPQYTEEERHWDISIRYADGSTQSTTLISGRSDKKLRMPHAVLSAEWIGQDGRDWTGRRAAVGPDGIQDVVLKINGLSDKLGVLMSLRVEVEGGPIWEYGPNPDKVWNAELMRESDKSPTAELLISPPEQSIAGKPLKLTVYYGYNRDHTFTGTAIAGRSNPTLKTPAPQRYDVRRIPRFSAQWLGQDGSDITGRGDVHVRVSGLPTRSPVVAAVLSSDIGGHWAGRINDNIPLQMPRAGRFTELAFRPVAGSRGTADLYFPPFRDERDGRMTLRIVLADGSQHFGQFDGGPCDPAIRGKLPNDKSIVVKPGDDLHAIVREYGHVTLSSGTYHFDRALELHQPITITGPREAIMLFRQPVTQEYWHESILVLADNVTLDGFSIRFDGPVRWKPFDWTRGCGVIQAPRRTKAEDELVNLIVRNMDIEDSEVSDPDPAKLQWLPDLVRSGRVLNGQIVGNTFRGGTIDVEQGPWLIADNVHRGAPAGGMAPAAFAGHYIHDVTVERNRVEGEQSPGKLWRFMVITQEGAKTIVRGNNIRGSAFAMKTRCRIPTRRRSSSPRRTACITKASRLALHPAGMSCRCRYRCGRGRGRGA